MMRLLITLTSVAWIASAQGAGDISKEQRDCRIAYANDQFTTGVTGAETDRGRVYILYGPPDEIESHPATADTYPFEIWRYRRIENVGSNVEIEFVDSAMTGDYRQTADPLEKDIHAGHTGKTLMELMGLTSGAASFHPDGVHLGTHPPVAQDGIRVQFNNNDLTLEIDGEPPKSLMRVTAWITPSGDAQQILDQIESAGTIVHQTIPLLRGTYQIRVRVEDVVTGRVTEEEFTPEPTSAPTGK